MDSELICITKERLSSSMAASNVSGVDQRAKVEEQITELQDALDVLKYKTWLYEVALEAGTTAIHDNMPLEDMPQNIRKLRNVSGV